MQRFAAAMLTGLTKAGVSAELALPPVWLGRLGASSTGGIGKWLAYLDKYLLFPILLKRRVRRARARRDGARLVVHICDHSNAMYSTAAGGSAVVVTCHDLLAVRGALGEETDCPASAAGRWLQRWILHSLSRCAIIVSVSSATRQDVERMVDLTRSDTRSYDVPIGLNHPYHPLSANEADARLAKITGLCAPFLLHVGSNLRRKNREGVLRIFAKTAPRWNGQLVFAGHRLTSELQALAGSLGISDRIVGVSGPSNDLLEALYNRATALLFPSRFEGFGWPVIEAQACGCPVICSASGPLPEVVGEGGLIHGLEDEAGFAEDVLRLANPAERDQWGQKALANARRFTTERMIDEYVRIYGEAAAEQ
jgi:glycosyltransferase involved in cell wall biosynthesis